MTTDYSEFQQKLLEKGADLSVLWLCRVHPVLLGQTQVGIQLKAMNGGQNFPESFRKKVKKDTLLATPAACPPSAACFAAHKQEACEGLLSKLKDPSTPVQPVVIQTGKGNGNFYGVFAAFQGAGAAMRFLKAVAENRFVQHGGNFIEANTFFEVPFLAGNTDIISSMVLDYEITHAAYKDDKGNHRQSLDEVMATARRFPFFLYNRMLETGVIQRSEKIRIVAKNKCRPILNTEGEKIDDKISFHFTVNIFGRLLYEHRWACHKMFGGKYMRDLEEFHRNKNQIPLTFDTSAEYLPLDPKTWNGKQPISTLGSLKKSTDPPCFLERFQLFQNGCEILNQPFPAATKDNMLEQLYASCFTVPKHSANYSEKFLQYCKREKQGSVNRTLTCHQTPCGGGVKKHPPFDGKKGEEKVPGWLLESAKEPVSVNSSIPCLSTYSTDLARLITNSSPLVSHRVQGVVCPYLLYGHHEHKVHRSNGVFVTVNPDTPDTIYAKCSSCTLPTTLSEEDTRVLVSTSPSRGWVEVNKDKFLQLLQLCKSKDTLPKSKKIKIKH